MATYDTTTLATAIIGEDEVKANRKQATRTLRKFLRTDFKAREMQTPGKGGRYSIDLNKRDLNAMMRRFKAWQEAEAKAAEARKEARAPKVEETPAIVEDAPEEITDDADDDADPTEADLDAMIAELATDED